MPACRRTTFAGKSIALSHFEIVMIACASDIFRPSSLDRVMMAGAILIAAFLVLGKFCRVPVPWRVDVRVRSAHRAHMRHAWQARLWPAVRNCQTQPSRKTKFATGDSVRRTLPTLRLCTVLRLQFRRPTHQCTRAKAGRRRRRRSIPIRVAEPTFTPTYSPAASVSLR